MKALVGIVLFAAAFGASAEWVNGYIKADGTYVPGYHRSTPNATTLDNYSTKGNTNPYTGQPGYATPAPRPPQPYSKPPQYQQLQPYQPIENYQPYTPYTPAPTYTPYQGRKSGY